MITYFNNIPVENMSARKSNITIADLLTMRSGYDWHDSAGSDPVFSSANPVSQLLNRSMIAEPGTQWNYDTGSCHILSAILSRTTGKSALEYANQKLFMSLGITNIAWDADKTGLNFGGFGLELTPRDMAKFGYLYLKKGKWNGVQLISEEWINDSTKVYSDTYWPSMGKYGYLFWIPDSRFYCTSGLYGQKIYIFPGLDMVVVFTANLPVAIAEDTLNNIVLNFILPAAEN